MIDILALIAADPNVDSGLKRALDQQHAKQAPRRFLADPEPLTGFGDIEDPRLPEWTADAKREDHEQREERANRYDRGGFGL